MVKEKTAAPSSEIVLKAFAEFVAAQWQQLARPHSFQPAGKNVPSSTFYSLADAANAYSFKNKSLEETKKLLEDLSERITSLLRVDSGQNHKLHHVCLEILEWGGLQGASSDWLRHRCDDGNLATHILDAKAELSGNKSPKELDTASVFHKKRAKPIPMNSGTTKIFALSDPDRIAIYDGRVGAGLALLSINFLTSKAGAEFRYKDPTKKTTNTVPPALGWRWGEGRTTTKTAGQRNPNTNEFRFGVLSSNTSLANAQEAWRASRLFKMVIEELRRKKIEISLPDIERAFFMIGYDLGRGG